MIYTFFIAIQLIQKCHGLNNTENISSTETYYMSTESLLLPRNPHIINESNSLKNQSSTTSTPVLNQLNNTGQSNKKESYSTNTTFLDEEKISPTPILELFRSKSVLNDIIYDDKVTDEITTTPLYSKERESQLTSSNQIFSVNKKNDDVCERGGKCEPLDKEITCFGMKLPYNYTSMSLTGISSQKVALKELEQWRFLKNIQKCWSVVQPFLCAVYFPKCTNSTVELPDKSMCSRATSGHCRLVDLERGWPEYLKCKEEYGAECQTKSKEIKFNTTGECSEPLVRTERKNASYEGLDYCGLPCKSPSFTEEEHKDIQKFILTLGGVALGFSVFTILTFLIDWRSANKYPAMIIFYMNVCFMLACIGFLVQFHTDEQIACRPDGTLRLVEPSSDGTLSCVAVFVCIYYFMMANGMWLIILAFAWYTTFKSLAAGNGQQEVEKWSAYFHLLAWSFPLMMTITMMALGKVQGDPVTGVCFLSNDLHLRIWCLLVPFFIVVVVAGYFLVKGLLTLVNLKLSCSNIISDHANKKISVTMMRLVLFMVCLVIVLIITSYCHVYHYLYEEEWSKALREYIMCKTKISSVSLNTSWSTCSINSKPSINMYKLHLLALFGASLMMSSWCWTRNTINAWKRFCRRVVGMETVDPPVRLTKHKVIAQAFAKRHDLNAVGRLSISLCSAHEDPLGMNFDINSCTSGDDSSLWAAAIPHLLNRRGAVVGGTALGPRRNSVDSEFSISRRLSLESGYTKSSRRHSLDSQTSLHVSDVERMAALHTVAKFSRRRRKDWLSLRKNRRGHGWDRRSSRGSNTSDDSNLGSMVLPSIGLDNRDSLFTNMMKRLNKLNASSDNSITSNNLKRNASINSNRDGVENNAFADDDNSKAIINTIIASNGKNISKSLFEAALALSSGKESSKDSSSLDVKSSAIAIQTINEMADKSCQVNTPMLIRAQESRLKIDPSAYSEFNQANSIVSKSSSDFGTIMTETSLLTKADSGESSEVKIDIEKCTYKRHNQSQRKNRPNSQVKSSLDLEES